MVSVEQHCSIHCTLCVSVCFCKRHDVNKWCTPLLCACVTIGVSGKIRWTSPNSCATHGKAAMMPAMLKVLKRCKCGSIMLLLLTVIHVQVHVLTAFLESVTPPGR